MKGKFENHCLSLIVATMLVPFITTVDCIAERGRARIQNGTIVADNGWPLRGDVFRPESGLNSCRTGYADQAWLDYRDKFNLNTVRVFIYIRSDQEDPYADIPGIDHCVDKAAEMGMYAVIDYHPVPPPGTHGIQHAKDWWSVVAPRYKDRTHVIYELCNEPGTYVDPTWNLASNFMMPLYRHVRALAPDTMLVVWTFPGINYEPNGMRWIVDAYPEVDYTNAVVGYHPYQWRDDYIQDLVDAGYPLFDTETSICGDPDNPQCLINAIQRTENWGFSWLGLEGMLAMDGECGTNYGSFAALTPQDVFWPQDPGVYGTPADPAITVTSPNGGENWLIGAMEIISWNSLGTVGNVNIDLSTDGGSNWSSIASNIPNTGSYSLTVPDNQSNSCLIRVQEPDGDPTDTSNNNFTITIDDVRPTLVSITPAGSNILDVEFSESVEQASAENTANYSIDKDISINNATLNGDLKTVALDTSEHMEGVNYTLTVNNVKDRAPVPNTIASNSQISYTYTGRCYLGTPFNIPGKIEVEDFDNGGEGVAYHDSDSGNSGNTYRTTEGVDIETCDEGGYNVGWTGAGEWLEYTVEIAATGAYTIEARVASSGAGNDFHVEFDGVDRTGTMSIPDTNGWQNWQTITKTGVSLNAGKQIMRIAIDDGGSGGNLNYINITLEGQVTPTITVTSPNGAETWTANTARTVTWTSIGTAGNVNIDLSTDGGVNWTSLVSGITNDGSQSITVSNSPSTSCKIRVQDVSGSPGDTSDNNFTIESAPEPPSISVTKAVLDFGEIETGKTSTLNFTITNTGGGILSGSISSDKLWIEVQPTSFENNTVDVNVTVDNSILNKSEGEYTDTISITSNGGNQDITVTLTATCVLVKPNPYDPAEGILKFFGDGIVPGETKIRIYTLSGELVKILENRDGNISSRNKTADTGCPCSSINIRVNEIRWDGKNENGEEVTNGIYVYLFESPKERGIGRFTVLRK